MKKIAWGILAALFLSFAAAPALYASEIELLVNKLVEKGVLTQFDGQIILNKAREQAAEKELKENLVKTTWNNRLQFETPDGRFKGQIGGRLHSDLVYMKGQGSLEERLGGVDLTREDNAFFRRARLYLQGTVYENFFYKLQWDFAGGTAGFRDAYVGMQNIPYIGKITAGQFKEPFSLEELTSSNNITFIERSLPNVFSPGRSWGAGVSNSWFDQRATLSLGAFRNSNETGAMVTGNEWNFTTRATALPWYEASDKLAHLGVGYSLRVPENNWLRFRQRPDIRIGTRFVDTGVIQADMDNRLGFEGAVVYGPLSFQGEFIQSFVDVQNRSRTGYLYGGYGYVSYFLTGENRRYSKGSGAFSGVSPKNNFSIKDRTWGAWELAARYSYLDLDDKKAGIEGGILSASTIGINWYLTPNIRAMFNYVHAHRNTAGYADGVQARLQVTF